VPFRVSNFGSRLSGFGVHMRPRRPSSRQPPNPPPPLCRFGFRISGFEYRVSGFTCVPAARLLDSFRMRLLRSAPFRISGLGFRISGFGFRVSHPCPQPAYWTFCESASAAAPRAAAAADRSACMPPTRENRLRALRSACIAPTRERDNRLQALRARRARNLSYLSPLARV